MGARHWTFELFAYCCYYQHRYCNSQSHQAGGWHVYDYNIVVAFLYYYHCCYYNYHSSVLMLWTVYIRFVIIARWGPVRVALSKNRCPEAISFDTKFSFKKKRPLLLQHEKIKRHTFINDTSNKRTLKFWVDKNSWTLRGTSGKRWQKNSIYESWM